MPPGHPTTPETTYWLWSIQPRRSGDRSNPRRPRPWRRPVPPGRRTPATGSSKTPSTPSAITPLGIDGQVTVDADRAESRRLEHPSAAGAGPTCGVSRPGERFVEVVFVWIALLHTGSRGTPSSAPHPSGAHKPTRGSTAEFLIRVGDEMETEKQRY